MEWGRASGLVVWGGPRIQWQRGEVEVRSGGGKARKGDGA